MSPKGLGWIIVDSLDTMMLMNLTEPLADARNLTWNQDQDINTFETTICMMGGLLSAHYLSTQLPHIASKRDSVYLAKAVDLADRLLVAYDFSSGISYASVNIGKREGIVSHADGGASSTAEAATVQLPTGVKGPLSPKMDHLVCFLPGTIAMAVSSRDPFLAHLSDVMRQATEGRTLAEALRDPNWTIHHEGDVKLAIEIMDTCWGMCAVTDTSLAPEITWFNASNADLQSQPGDRWLRTQGSALSKWKEDYTIKPLDAHNLQRPETVESVFMMYRITGNSIYREWGWKILQSFQKHTIVPDGEGYTSLNDVRTAPPEARDNMESFWLAETHKYLYLLFSPTDCMPLTEVVFNTEAHSFPRFTPKGSLKTGW
ncbi:mannosyl-oligosaccharide 1,2-alpha-mannosidase MNS3 [Colletotrichum spaethianum]|uniref:alpha-1,2-Mannosidase n=1 Tax=Colletotrichum spaethianum TaxID=700344 RepID=A0AA37LAW6_9PEZI|nr:mannosyl-oligosaccharide 1,2-alpha-mannosidase MNS3 [Colletotrichum spaethianum]GKT42610.1 mannosyl-oligosaccharide 1,2-alpha-mannosidase MNS3 [Colletotrichum spaethianum]